MKITQWNYFWLLIRSPIEIQFSQQEIMYNCELFHTSPKKLTIVHEGQKRWGVLNGLCKQCNTKGAL